MSHLLHSEINIQKKRTYPHLPYLITDTTRRAQYSERLTGCSASTSYTGTAVAPLISVSAKHH
jgi:hypothetical protein